MDNGVFTPPINDERSPSDEQENILNSESEAPISERAALGISEIPGVGSPRVQFENIQEECDPLSPLDEHMSDDERKSRRHHNKYHDHK